MSGTHFGASCATADTALPETDLLMKLPQALLPRRALPWAAALLMGLAANPSWAVRAVASPQGEVATLRQVSLRFDADVVPLGDPRLPPPAALQCERMPPPAGSGRWNSARQWVLDLEQPLPAASRCELKLLPGWKPLTGALEGPQVFRVATAGPAVAQVWPQSWQEVEEDQHFLLRLTGPVVPASVLQNAWCEVEGLGERIAVRPVEGAPRDALLARYRLKGQADSVLLLACSRPFPAGAKVRLVWGEGMAARANPQVLSRTAQRYEWTVRQRFEAEFSCERERADAPCMPLRPVSVRFTAPVPRKLLAGASLQAEGGAAFKPVLEEGGDTETLQQIRFAAPLPESARFTLSLPKGLVDATGRALANAGSFPLRTSTGALPPLAKLAAAPFGIVEAGPEAMLPVTVRQVQADLAGVSASGQVRVKRLDAGTSDAELLRWIGQVQRYHESSLSAKEAGLPRSQWMETVEEEGDDGKPRRYQRERRVGTRELSLLTGRPEARSLPLPALADAAQPGSAPRPFEVLGIPMPQTGYHVVEIESRLLGAKLLAKPAPMYVRGGVLVTQLGVHFKRGREDSLVWVTTLDRAQPVAGARVAVSDCRGQLLWSGTTDAQGRAKVPRGFDSRDSQQDCLAESGWFVTARHTRPAAGGQPAQEDLAFVFSGWNKGIEPWRFNLPTSEGTDPDWRAHTVFDRTLLRAGETVGMKHYLRTETSRGLGLPPAAEMPDTLRITHQGSGEQVDLPLAWRGGPQAGTSVSQWAVPATAKLGLYDVALLRKGGGQGQREWPSGSFRVEAFRVPLLDARLAAPKGTQVAPAELAFQLQLNYQSGGGVAAAPAQLSALLRERSPAFAGYEDYSFRPPEALKSGAVDEAADDEEDGGEGGTGSRDSARIVADKLPLRTDANGAAKAVLNKLPALDRPAELVGEVSFSDPNGEVQTVSQTVPLWPSGVVVGLRARSWVASRGQVGVQALVLDVSGKPLAGRSVTVRGELQKLLSTRKRMVGGFYAYEHRREVTTLGELCKGKTDARGLLVCDARLEVAGEVQLVAESVDDAGRPSRSATSVWITGQGELWFAQDNDDRIDLIPEKRELQPGETARLQVRMPYREATVLLAVEREGVMDTRVLTLRGDEPVIELPIPKAPPSRPGAGAGQADAALSWAPNVFVSALVLRGRVREVPWYSFFSWGWKQPLDWWRAWRGEGKDYQPPTAMVDLAKPSFKLGATQLRIGLEAQRLQVSVVADQPQYAVRQTARVRVKVTQGGAPAAGATVAFAAVDEALLALKPNDSWDLLAALMQPRAWGVETSTAQSEIIGRRHYGRKAVPAGGGGGRNPTRELFDTLLLWQPDVALDARGEALVEVPLNDSLTRFRLVAVASRLPGDQGMERFGSGSATVAVTQDLQMLAGLPPLVREGDQFSATLTLRNTTGRAMTVKAGLQAVPEQAGPEAPTAGAAGNAVPAGLPPALTFSPQQLTLAAGAATEVRWPVTVPPGIGSLRWTATAEELPAAGTRAAAPGAAAAGRATDRLQVRQQVAPAVPLRIWASQVLKLDPAAPQSLPVAPPADAVASPGGSARGGVLASLRPRLAGAQPGVQRFFEQYPFQCLEQQASRAVGLHDAAAWARVAAALPGYLDADGLAQYYPGGDGAPRGSDRLTAYLLSLADEAGLAWPQAQREAMLNGLAAFVEGRLERRSPANRADLDVRKLAALEALSRHGRATVRQLGSLQITPQRWPTAALIDWWLLLRRLPDLPDRAARQQEAEQLLRSRLTYAGTQLRFSTEEADFWWWLMDSADGNAARLILAASDQPAWRDDLPAMVLGALARQRQGAWLTTTANAWGVLALDRFSARFESTPVAGRSQLQLGAAQAAVDWAATPGGAQRELPWPASAGPLRAEHKGSGAPWLTVQTLAAVPLKAPLEAGYRLKRTVSAVSQAQPGRWSRGDVMRVRLEIDAAADMTWVGLSDPLPAGATVMGSGLGGDSQLATRGEQASGATPTYIERATEAWRGVYEWLPKGRHVVEYTVRLNSSGRFALPPSRIEAMYAPESFGELPNATLEVAAP